MSLERPGNTTGWLGRLRTTPALALAVSMALWVALVAGLRLGASASEPLAAAVGSFAAGGLLAAVSLANYVAAGETEVLRRQRGRNVAISLALGGLVLLFYVATLVRLGSTVLNR